MALPGMTTVVVGNTGAGKSTLINGLLGESNVLPTNGMRACTVGDSTFWFLPIHLVGLFVVRVRVFGNASR
jgi:ABC-type transport system involved in cytochrome bd biosynthesis fused ATPase/permease subunit